MVAPQKKLLYLVHRIPYPPNKGDKIRSFNILKFLACHYQIHLAAFVDDDNDWAYLSELDRYCVDKYVAPLKASRAKLRSLPALLGNQPMSVPYYGDSGVQAWVDAQRQQYQFDAVLVFSSAMAQYVMSEAWSDIRRVIDFVDVDSDKWLQYADNKSWPMSWVYRREGRTLLQYDKRVAEVFDVSLFVSEKEAELFSSISEVPGSKVTHANNGVDTDYFLPGGDYPNPFCENEQAIVFTGAMDYWANVDAVVWFAREVMPAILASHLDARFYIVGAKPTAEVLALRSVAGVNVTGAVQEIRPYLAHSRLAVAPMRIARGVQNKVLEAMAMAKAVVVSPQGVDGIVAEAAGEVIVGQDAESFEKAVSSLLDDPDRAVQMGKAARAAIKQHYAWETSMQTLIPLLEG